jgi:hypothetical protein
MEEYKKAIEQSETPPDNFRTGVFFGGARCKTLIFM